MDEWKRAVRTTGRSDGGAAACYVVSFLTTKETSFTENTHTLPYKNFPGCVIPPKFISKEASRVQFCLYPRMEKQQLIWKPVPKFSPPSLWHFFACIWWHKALAAIPAPYLLSCAPLAAAWLHSLPFNSQYPQRGYWGDSALQWGAQQENKKQRPHPAEAGAPISSRSQNVPAQGLALLEGLFQELPLEHLSSRVVILRCFTGVGGQKDHCDQCEEKVMPISSSNEGHDEQWGVWELWHHPLVAPLHDHQARSPAWWEEGPQCKHPKSASSPTPEWAPFKFLFGDWGGNHDHQQGGPQKRGSRNGLQKVPCCLQEHWAKEPLPWSWFPSYVASGSFIYVHNGEE